MASASWASDANLDPYCASAIFCGCLCFWSSAQQTVSDVQIADTVVVKPGSAPAENMCTQASKSWDKVSYTLNDEEEQDDVPDALEEVTNGNVMVGAKKLRSDDPNYKSNEQHR